MIHSVIKSQGTFNLNKIDRLQYMFNELPDLLFHLPSTVL